MRWHPSNGSSASSSPTVHLTDIIKRLITRTGRGERTASELTPLSEMQIKAEIARPAEGETVRANTSVRVCGAAWACDAEITKVELSTDGGATWNDAKLLGESNVERVAIVGVQLADTVATGETNSHGPRYRFARPNATGASRSRSRHLHDQSSAADRSRSEMSSGERARLACWRSCPRDRELFSPWQISRPTL